MGACDHPTDKPAAKLQAATVHRFVIGQPGDCHSLILDDRPIVVEHVDARDHGPTYRPIDKDSELRITIAQEPASCVMRSSIFGFVA